MLLVTIVQTPSILSLPSSLTEQPTYYLAVIVAFVHPSSTSNTVTCTLFALFIVLTITIATTTSTSF